MIVAVLVGFAVLIGGIKVAGAAENTWSVKRGYVSTTVETGANDVQPAFPLSSLHLAAALRGNGDLLITVTSYVFMSDMIDNPGFKVKPDLIVDGVKLSGKVESLDKGIQLTLTGQEKNRL